jgi:glycosyltransferase involved in cell wall biosynthesis
MKILIATGLYPPDIGGPATYSKLLSEELPKRDIRVNVLSFGEVRHRSKIVRHITYFLKALIRARGSSVIYAQDPVSVGFPSILAAKILRKKFVLKIVGDYAWEQHQQKKDSKFITLENFQKDEFGFMTELRKKIERWVAKKADVIIVPSEYLKKIVMMWGIDKKKINVVYNAFSSGDINADISIRFEVKDNLKRKFEIDGPIILSIGRLVAWKGFDTLIELMPQISREIPGAKLLIIGDGPDKEVLESKADEKDPGKLSNMEYWAPGEKKEKNTFLLGRLPRRELLQYLRAADVFVLNTGYEGFSHQLLETMSVGTSIITTNVGGNPELIENGKTGVLVEYNNREEIKEAIINLLQEEEFAEKLAENAQKKVTEFSIERMMNETIKVLNS